MGKISGAISLTELSILSCLMELKACIGKVNCKFHENVAR